ncbi:MAG TPA: hypothetical protein VHR66_02750 [Gemmataceae bacterium]|jgi:hypothetical protein|nr:hypothetical protein [Gemmataceae bacterium]
MLAVTDPAAIPAALVEHLEACSGCQAWQQLLTRIDGAVVATGPAAYAGKAKQALLEKFAAPKLVVAKSGSGIKLNKPAPKAVVVVQPAAPRRPLGESLARFWPAGVAAAVILTGVLIWSSLRNGKSDGPTVAAVPADPFLDKVVTAKVNLDRAPDATARLNVLDVLGSDIHTEARTLAQFTPGAEMESLAAMYDKVVGEAMFEQARGLNLEEKRANLPKFIEHLSKAEQDANKLAADAPPGSVQPLKEMARSAQKGRIALAQLMQQGQG